MATSIENCREVTLMCRVYIGGFSGHEPVALANVQVTD